jgi:anti-sigma B factor antagonist
MSMDVLIEEPVGFRLEEERFEPAGLVLTVHGELDMATAPELRARLGAAARDRVRALVLDLRPVAFLDSVAVAAILHARRQLGDGGRMAIVIDPDSYTRMVFEIAGLPQCLDIVETLHDAVAHVSG